MSATPSWLTPDRLQRVAPLVLPLAILVFAWLVFVQPRQTAARRAGEEIAVLEPRVTELSPILDSPAETTSADELAPEMIRRLPQVDPMPDVLERLARLALIGTNHPDAPHGAVSDLLIETGEHAITGEAAGTAPRAAGPAEPDPRVALFGVPLAYTRVTVTFESSYERLGQFLWDMGELPTIVEVHALDVRPSSPDGARLRTTMTLFVYRRAPNGDVRTVARAGAPA